MRLLFSPRGVTPKGTLWSIERTFYGLSAKWYETMAFLVTCDKYHVQSTYSIIWSIFQQCPFDHFTHLLINTICINSFPTRPIRPSVSYWSSIGSILSCLRGMMDHLFGSPPLAPFPSAYFRILRFVLIWDRRGRWHSCLGTDNSAERQRMKWEEDRREERPMGAKGPIPAKITWISTEFTWIPADQPAEADYLWKSEI